LDVPKSMPPYAGCIAASCRCFAAAHRRRRMTRHPDNRTVSAELNVCV
jgi:hypothetical protein